MHIRSQINALRHIVDTLEGRTRADMITELKAQGFRQLGRGCFAVVMAHSVYPDLVVKLGQNRSGRRHVRHLTDGFETYVDFLKTSGTKSKFALKVYHHRHVSGFNGGTYATVIERCFPGKGCKAQQSVTGAAQITLYGRNYSTAAPSTAAVRFLRQLRDHGKLDCHAGNVMVRRDGTPVVTDPLVHQN